MIELMITVALSYDELRATVVALLHRIEDYRKLAEEFNNPVWSQRANELDAVVAKLNKVQVKPIER